MANVAVGGMRKTEVFDLNGGMSLKAVLALYFRCEATDRAVGAAVTGQTVRLNSTNCAIPADLGRELRANDFISIYPNEVAQGGVKGAA